MIKRRTFLAAAASLAATGSVAALPSLLHGAAGDSIPASLDHIILGVSDLDRGIAWVEQRSGVRAVMGGVHPGRGTRNALLSLGTRRYLEIMAPDPAQPGSGDTRGLSHLGSPRIIGWASHLDSAANVANRLRKAGVAFSGPTPGSRKRPDGRVLDWTTVELEDDAAGILPFFIEWGPNSPHPSEDSPAGLRLVSFSAESQDVTPSSTVSAALGLGLRVRRRPHAALRATFQGRKGEFSL